MPNIKLRGVVSTLYNGTTKLGALRDVNIDDSAPTVDASDHDSGNYGSKMGTFSQISISANFFYLGDSVTGVLDTGLAALRTAKVNATVLTLKHRPNGDGTGKAEEQYPVVVTSIKTAAPVAGIQTFDVQFEGTGAPTITVQ